MCVCVFYIETPGLNGFVRLISFHGVELGRLPTSIIEYHEYQACGGV